MSFSIISCLFVVMREKLYLRMSKSRGESEKNDTLGSSGRLYNILIECAILMVHPYPFFVGKKHVLQRNTIGEASGEIYYHINDFFHLFSLFRFLFKLISVLNISVWQSRSALRICNMYGCEGGPTFTIKCLMKATPWSFNLMVFSFFVFFYSQALRICEAPLSRLDGLDYGMNFYDFVNAVWLTVMTMATGENQIRQFLTFFVKFFNF